jgi:hypothetical protein
LKLVIFENNSILKRIETKAFPKTDLTFITILHRLHFSVSNVFQTVDHFSRFDLNQSHNCHELKR